MENNGMHNAAQFYYDQGINVIPVNGITKQPLVKWDQYQKERISENEFKNWVAQGLFNDGIALICGQISNGLHAIDIDDKTIIDKEKLPLESLVKRGYWCEETTRGYHIIARTMGPIPKWTKNGHLEYLGSERLCIVAPSPGKRLIGVTSPSELPDLCIDDKLFDKFKNWCVKYNGGEPKKDYREGVTHGERNNAAFILACKHRDNGLTHDDALSLLQEWNNKNVPPLEQIELQACVKSAYKYSHPITIYPEGPQTLEEVHTRLKKWLHLTDELHIDLMLATYLSIQSPDPPLWILTLAASGDSKTATSMGLYNAHQVIPIDQITKNTLASGMKNAHDLGEELQHSSHILLIPDLACFSTLPGDDKKLVWGQFRTLHDGYINKMTGNDIRKKYEGCHVALIGCGVPSFKNEQIVKDQLGTRELIYMMPSGDKAENLLKVQKAITHRNLKEQMDYDIRSAMQGFLQQKKFNTELVTPPEISEYLEKKVFELALFRATAQIDYYEGEIFGTVDQEVPTRVAQQFDLLYRSLHSLDPNYPDEKFKKIIENMVSSSSVPLRKDLYEYFVKNQKKLELIVERNVNQLSQELNKSRKAIKIQCLILVELGILDVEYRAETVGYRSFEQEVAYFRLKNAQTTLDTPEAKP